MPKHPTGLILTLLFTSASSLAANIQVPGDQPTIQAAIDAADDGDVIVIAPGVYFEHVDCSGTSVTFRGEAGAGATILDGSTGTTPILTCLDGESVIIEDLTLTGADPDANSGGAIRAATTSLIVRDCRFDDNKNEFGSAANVSGGVVTFERCDFVDGYGGALVLEDAIVAIHDCGFMDHFCPCNGGGFEATNCTLDVARCRFINNSASEIGGAGAIIGGVFTIADCDFHDNHCDTGGSIVALDTDPGSTIRHCRFLDESACDGGALVITGAVQIENCMFESCSGCKEGGVAKVADTSDAVFRNCVFNDNVSDVGGVFWVEDEATLDCVNCLFIDNGTSFSGQNAGVIYATGSADVSFTNCTMRGNAGNDGSVARIVNKAVLTLDNCIAWNQEEPLLEAAFGGTIDVRYSLVQGGADGPGNLDTNPLFVDGETNLRLSPGSPAIDAGDNLAPGLDGVALDFARRNRFVDDPDTRDSGNPDGRNPLVDMGAYEFDGRAASCLADLDANGHVDAVDLAMLLAAWGDVDDSPADVTGDGDVDEGDLAWLLAAWGRCY